MSAIEVINKYLKREQEELEKIIGKYKNKETPQQLESRERPQRMRIKLLQDILNELHTSS